MILIDTCTISEVRKRKASRKVLDWFRDARDHDLYMSVVTIGELRKGAAAVKDTKVEVKVRQWISDIEMDFQDRVLGIDMAVAQLWGETTGRLKRQGLTLPAADGLIAATALRHNMFVATRNVKDFEPTGVGVINPWD